MTNIQLFRVVKPVRRARARLDIRTGRLTNTHVVSRQGVRSASEIQSSLAALKSIEYAGMA